MCCHHPKFPAQTYRYEKFELFNTDEPGGSAREGGPESTWLRLVLHILVQNGVLSLELLMGSFYTSKI